MVGDRRSAIHERLRQINETGSMRMVIIDEPDSPFTTIETTCTVCGEVLASSRFDASKLGERGRAEAQGVADALRAVLHVQAHAGGG